ncbi:MAG: hypothetical protein RQ875_05500 [Vicingaceae bacterium]|nr:hypothetical protein [Vicingaceae bacterium]
MKKLLFILLFILSNLLNAQCYKEGIVLGGAYVTSTTGEKLIDNSGISEINQLQSFFGVNVNFFFIHELQNEGSAFFHPTCTDYNCIGTIYLGMKMMVEQYKKHGNAETIKAILAHEFGHAIQQLVSWKEKGKWRELHSDFLAGFYIGKKYDYSEEEMNLFYKEFYDIGDNNFWSPEHHGTPIERECAFLEGYYYAKENNVTVQTAHLYGIEYIALNNPCGVRKYKAKLDNWDKNVKAKNVGNLFFEAEDGGKYRVLTNNQVDNAINFHINQRVVKGAGFKYKGAKVSSFNVNNIIPTDAHPLYIYKTGNRGEYLWKTYNVKIVKGETTFVTIDMMGEIQSKLGNEKARLIDNNSEINKKDLQNEEGWSLNNNKHPKKGFTSLTTEIVSKYELNEVKFKKLQFYISNDVILSKQEINTNGDTIFNNKILIKENTPGLCVKIISKDKIAISFSESQEQYLVFGSSNNSGKYYLMGAEWNNGRGKINYGGKLYYIMPGGAQAHLQFILQKK